MKKLLPALLISLMTSATATIALAQDAPRGSENKAKVEGRAGDTNFDVRIQGEQAREGRAQRPPQPNEGERGVSGPQGPAGAPGPQGPAGPAGASGGTFLGMDPTLALFLGLGVFAIVVIAIVASSRGGSRQV